MLGATTGSVRWILRLESLSILLAAILLYEHLGLDWQSFAIFFLAPDLSFIAFLAGPRVGAIVYNAAHSYIGAMTCLAYGFLIPIPLLITVGIIWSAHIGFDRFLGYGLKYAIGFRFTHLGRIGRDT